MGPSVFLGIDCGLSLVKAVSFTKDGLKIREARRKTVAHAGEIDAEALWANVCACIQEASAGLSIEACGLSGHGNGLYGLDARGAVVAALPPMASFQPFVAHEERYFAIARQSVWAGQPMQLLRRMKGSEPDRYAAICHILQCKDFIRFRLTGTLAAEYSDASAAALLDAETGEYSEELLALCGVADKAAAFAPLTAGYSIAGRVTPEAARACALPAGTPVAAGLFDASACMLGAGVLDACRYSITAGTWAISALTVDAPVASQEITQSCRFYDREHHIAVVSAPVSCVNLDWFIQNVRPELSYEEANSIAQSFAPGDVRAIYLPYLYPDMRFPGVRAGFVGLRPQDTWREMLRAVYEGVMFAHRLQIERLQRAGLCARLACLSGGASNAMLWKRLFANGIGLALEIPREKQVGALGAAIAAATAVRAYSGIEPATRAMAHIAERFDPQPEAAYDEKYDQFLRLIGEKT